MKYLESFKLIIIHTFIINYNKTRIWNIAKTFFIILGTYWSLIEFFSFLFEGVPTNVEGETYKDILRATIWEYLRYEFLFFAIIAIIQNRQRISHKIRINNSDLIIEFKFCDILRQDGAKVIAVMDTFESEFRDNLVDQNTLQGKVISKYYTGKETNLDNEINQSLKRTNTILLDSDENLKGKKDRYPIGSTVIIQPENEYFYWAALAAQTDTGNVIIKPEYLIDALSNLWQFIPKYGKRFDIINIPVIGKGIDRLPPEYTHQRIIREIANSFITSSKQLKFCTTLRICIYPKDSQYIDINKIIDYVNHLKEYNFI
jgi:hypothetical protein